MADNNTNGDYQTTIGPDASFKGEMQFKKGMRLFGQFEGQIDSKGELMIAEGAKLLGEAAADSIKIEGFVKGNVSADGCVQLSDSARLEGDIRTSRLQVADGAILIGRCSVGAGQGNGSAKPQAPQAQTPPNKGAQQGGKR